MAAKSIIEIEVKDEAFKRFHDLFAKYQDQVKELPSAWGDVGAEVEKAGAVLEAQTAGMLVQNQLLKEQQENWDKQKDAEKQLLDLEKKRRDNIHAMWTDTVAMAKQVGNITLDMLKWVGLGSIFSGLVGAGGLWGLDSMAHSVSDNRRSAQGLGVSTGQLQSLGINYSRYLDVNSNLENIANAQTDMSKRWAFNAMGVNPNRKDPAQLMIEMAEQTKRMVQAVPASQLAQYAAAHGLDQFYSMDDLRRLKNPGSDLAGARAGYNKDLPSLQRMDEVNKKWQDFSVQMGRASAEIQAAFIDGLAPIIPDLTKFSEGVAAAIRTFFKTHDVEKAVEKVGVALGHFADYVSSPKFEEDIKTFMTDFSALAKWVQGVLVRFHIIPDPSMVPSAAADKTPWNGDPNPFSAGNLGRRDRSLPIGKDDLAAARFFMGRGYSAQQAAGIIANLDAESGNAAHAGKFSGKYGMGGDPDASGHATAFGAGQWHEDRIKLFEAWAHKTHQADFAHSTLPEQWAFVDWELKNNERRVGDRLRRTTDARQAGFLVSEGYERPKNGLSEASVRATGAAQVLIRIQNQTGANVQVNGTQVVK